VRAFGQRLGSTSDRSRSITVETAVDVCSIRIDLLEDLAVVRHERELSRGLPELDPVMNEFDRILREVEELP